MITIDLPHGETLAFTHAVFDYNGTLATDGVVSEQTKCLLAELAERVHVTVITADTFGLAHNQLHDLEKIKLIILDAEQGGSGKANYVKACGPETVVAIGNGQNDRAMFDAASLSICVVGKEGASVKTLVAADIVVTATEDAIRLLLNAKRVIATLRR